MPIAHGTVKAGCGGGRSTRGAGPEKSGTKGRRLAAPLSAFQGEASRHLAQLPAPVPPSNTCESSCTCRPAARPLPRVRADSYPPGRDVRSLPPPPSTSPPGPQARPASTRSLTLLRTYTSNQYHRRYTNAFLPLPLAPHTPPAPPGQAGYNVPPPGSAPNPKHARAYYRAHGMGMEFGEGGPIRCGGPFGGYATETDFYRAMLRWAAAVVGLPYRSWCRAPALRNHIATRVPHACSLQADVRSVGMQHILDWESLTSLACHWCRWPCLPLRAQDHAQQPLRAGGDGPHGHPAGVHVRVRSQRVSAGCVGAGAERGVQCSVHVPQPAAC